MHKRIFRGEELGGLTSHFRDTTNDTCGDVTSSFFYRATKPSVSAFALHVAGDFTWVNRLEARTQGLWPLNPLGQHATLDGVVSFRQVVQVEQTTTGLDF